MLSKVALCQELSNSSKPDNWQSCCQSSNWAAFFAFPTSLQETWPGHISHTHLFQFFTGEILSTNLKKYFPKIWRNLARAHISYTSSSCCDPILALPCPLLLPQFTPREAKLTISFVPGLIKRLKQDLQYSPEPGGIRTPTKFILHEKPLRAQLWHSIAYILLIIRINLKCPCRPNPWSTGCILRLGIVSPAP